MSQVAALQSNHQAFSSAPQEVACSFGEASQIIGVYTPPQQADACDVCAIYITAGLLHHVGPTRLHVELARDLSKQNVASLRFDLSGIGDSETSSLGGYFTERSVAEIRSAMDYLQQQYQHTKFVLVGLCSGADDALATAQLDTRVHGLVLLNGYAYQAGKYKAGLFKEFYVPRIFTLDKWKSKLSKLFSASENSQASPAETAANDDTMSAEERASIIALDDDYRYIPPKAETGQLIQALAAERVQLFFVYSGSEYDTYTYQGQLIDMFPELAGSELVKEAYLKEADHTYVLKADREKLSTWLQDWFASSEFARRA